MSMTFYVGDYGKKIGINFRATTCASSEPLNISDATSTEVLFRKPSGETVALAGAWADFPDESGTPSAGDGSDGRIMVTVTTPAFFNEVGTWRFQGSAQRSGVYDHASEEGSFDVYHRLGHAP